MRKRLAGAVRQLLHLREEVPDRVAHPLGRAAADAGRLGHLVQRQALGARRQPPGQVEQQRRLLVPHVPTTVFDVTETLAGRALDRYARCSLSNCAT